eukprot:GHVN01010559.1.p1 GENE.GHVN01010559.1~~GHVN01010559.1.p1  ORF type:complete len:227 (+),score=20.97 GHVN01010559.1:109-789(+)
MKPQSTAGGEKCPIGASGSKVVGGLCVGVILGTDMITNRWKLPLNTVLIPSHLCSWACLAGTSVWTMGRQWRVLTLSGDYENKLAAAIEEIGSIYHGFTVASVEAACLYFSTVALSKALSSAPKTARGFPVTSSCLSACALTAVGANLGGSSLVKHSFSHFLFHLTRRYSPALFLVLSFSLTCTLRFRVNSDSPVSHQRFHSPRINSLILKFTKTPFPQCLTSTLF